MVAISGSINQVFEVTVIKLLRGITGAIPDDVKPYFALGFAIIGILAYAIFVWKFYRFLARRDIIELNLKQYNRMELPVFHKLAALILFLIEFVIVLPILVFFWFFIMALILLLLAKDLPIGNILLVSASIVGAVRIASYYSQALARELAKMFPLMILVIAILTPGFFSVESTISKLGQIGDILPHIFIYLVLIMIIEFVLRMLYLLFPEGPKEEV